jgi:hypothetical protein
MAAPRKRRKVEGIIVMHFMESLVAEATIIFLVNGLTILLVLGDQIAGGIQMIVGIVLSMSLLLWLITSEPEFTLRRFIFAFSLVLGLVAGQLLFFLFYGPDPISPWAGFVLMIGTMALFAWLVAKRIERHD